MAPTHTVYISAHHVPGRVGLLARVLDAILGWEGCRVEVNLVTDGEALGHEKAIAERQRRFREAGSALRLVVARDLEHPFHLTWCHKRFVEPWARSAGEEELFVYLEDDVVLDAAAIRYFRRYRPLLRPLGLIPGYVRFERRPDGACVAVDLPRPEFYGHRDSARLGDGLVAHVCRNPYWAGFILDTELAREYVGSPSFDIEASRFIRWDVRARAAMGPCFERVPAGFSARNAVVLERGRPAAGALVWHCADTYAAGGDPYFARVPVEDAFVTGSAPAFWVARLRGRLADRRSAPRLDPGAAGETG